MLQLDGKIALVTGGGRGVGRGVSVELARRGADVMVADKFKDDNGVGAAAGVAAEIEACGGHAHANHGDVASFAGAQAIVDDTVRVFGGIDILVNCAGNYASSNVLEIEEPEWDAINAVHLTGHAGCIRAAAAHMIEQRRGGRIITISSRGAFWGVGGIAYSAAKAGIMGLTASLASALRGEGITVNCILPSATTQLFPSDASKRTLGGMPASQDMDPDHIAPVVAYLCASAAAAISGRYWYVSGGDISFYAHPLVLEDSTLFVRKAGVWDVDELATIVPTILANVDVVETVAKDCN